MVLLSVFLFNAATAAAAVASGGGVYDITVGEFYSKQKLGKQYFDQFYTLKVEIGTPPQEFTLLPDTGSPDTWVTGASLKRKGEPFFKPGASSTFVNDSKPWMFDYGGPKDFTYAEGYAARDTVTIGNKGSELRLRDETFAVATKAKGNPPPAVEGIFGLTYSAHVSSYNKPVYVQQAIDRGLLKEQRFGIHLRRASDALMALPKKAGGYLRNHGGTIRLGGIDKTKFTGPITYTPVQQHKGFWQVHIDGIYVNGQLVPRTKGYPAIVDTGTTIAILTPNQAKEFYQILGVGTPINSAEYKVPCSTVMDVQVKIGNATIPIKAQDLNAGYADKSREECVTRVIALNAKNASKNGTYPTHAHDIIVLGLPFILNTYAIFDYSHGGRVGVAQLADNGKLPVVAPIDIAEK